MAQTERAGGVTEGAALGPDRVMAGSDAWLEPTTQHVYPFTFEAYRLTREREERWPPRHERLGYQVERNQWREWSAGSHSAVTLKVLPKVPPRIQRIICDVLRAIQRGRSVDQAISHTSRRLRVKPLRVRAWIAAHIECHRLTL